MLCCDGIWGLELRGQIKLPITKEHRKNAAFPHSPPHPDGVPFYYDRLPQSCLHDNFVLLSVCFPEQRFACFPWLISRIPASVVITPGFPAPNGVAPRRPGVRPEKTRGRLIDYDIRAASRRPPAPAADPQSAAGVARLLSPLAVTIGILVSAVNRINQHWLQALSS